MTRKRLIFILLASAFLPAFICSTANTETVCFKCHDKKLFKKNVVHAPIAKGKCSACHNPHVARYEKLVNEQGADLCFSCHGNKKEEFRQGITHAPVGRGECSACHDPHSSSVKGLVKGKSIAASCFKCHSTLPKSFKVTHRPYAKGQCSVCHDPHQSNQTQLLKQAPNKICAKCHKAGRLQAVHKNFPAEVRDCSSCHNPHGSNRKGLLRNVLHKPYTQGCKICHTKGKNNEQNCLRCHEKVRKEFNTSHSHMIGGKGNSCVNCHSPHAGDGPGLFKGAQKNACRKCHENSIRKSENKYHRHPDINKCSNCHAPHGSNELAMMKEDHNKVCMACHETQGKFTHPVGERVFDPRTGQRVTCVSCHNSMGTDFKFHLKASGGKELCIQCHRSY